jgi:hypothetical protein
MKTESSITTFELQFLPIIDFFYQFLPKNIANDELYNLKNKDLQGLPLADINILRFLEKNPEIIPKKIRDIDSTVTGLAIWFLKEPCQCCEHTDCFHPYALIRDNNNSWKENTYYGPCWGDYGNLSGYNLKDNTFIAIVKTS